ncbi:DUF1934 domain-containing protein [Alkaliphilus sp. MSJ-5]|uniref:DUF1934 domain-containing protein n=1 Tax=Alkaliphilus flagellatus TaxID=2841507 RepID=A0ABS6G138_9FIRM|nr:DUF1934 domain-containing protein [Alkaliphilus flagellatus]MBU5676098.1 DUF1934 domain-containing protein [Alkaliphilus flagellatus]
MKSTRMIRVIGIQQNSDGEESTIELTTEGSVYEKNGSYYILYDESEISGMEGSTTRIKIENNKKVSMKRSGASAVDFIFEQGKKYESNYMTAYGDFTMKVTTNVLDVEISEETGKGKIDIDYDLKILGGVRTSNKLQIQLM